MNSGSDIQNSQAPTPYSIPPANSRVRLCVNLSPFTPDSIQSFKSNPEDTACQDELMRRVVHDFLQNNLNIQQETIETNENNLSSPVLN